MKNCNTNTTMWKDIPGYEGLYKVSDSGDVYNIKSKRKLKLTVSDAGYHKVNLRNNGSVKTHLVHRLVALSFIPNPKEKPQVNHIDEDSLNNSLSNLEWCTPKENCNHGTRLERIRNLIDYEVVAKKNSNTGTLYRLFYTASFHVVYRVKEYRQRYTSRIVNNFVCHLEYFHFFFPLFFNILSVTTIASANIVIWISVVIILLPYIHIYHRH